MESGMFEDEFQNDGSFLHDEFEDGENFEDTENETSDATDDPKRQGWLVQIRSMTFNFLHFITKFVHVLIDSFYIKQLTLSFLQI